jgi:hypothetical protein
MRYDQGHFRGYDRGWTGGPGRPMPRYDQTFRAGRGGYDAGLRGYDRGMRGYDAGYGGDGAWNTSFGRAAHPSVNQHVETGETDFLGRPYPRAAQEDVPWGLIDQDRSRGRSRGYDTGFQPGGGGYTGRDLRGGWGMRGYDRGFAGGGPGAGGGYAGGGYGGARGYDRVAGMRHGGSYGGEWGYDHQMRPEDFHARNLPDSDVGGVDAHRYGRGRDLRYQSNWTRWF